MAWPACVSSLRSRLHLVCRLHACASSGRAFGRLGSKRGSVRHLHLVWPNLSKVRLRSLPPRALRYQPACPRTHTHVLALTLTRTQTHAGALARWSRRARERARTHTRAAFGFRALTRTHSHNHTRAHATKLHIHPERASKQIYFQRGTASTQQHSERVSAQWNDSARLALFAGSLDCMRRQ